MAQRHPELPWLIGEGWTPSAFPRGLAAAGLLDAVERPRPVFLVSGDGYAAWVNSRALELAGIGPETADPVGGRIERDADGTPLGTLQGRALDLVERLTPPTTDREREEALRRGQAFLQRMGIGSWQDADVDPDAQGAYLALAGRGELTGRAALALRWDPGRGTSQVPELVARRQAVLDGGGDRLRAPTVKIFQDGIIENATAALLAPYLDGQGRSRGDRGDSHYGTRDLRDLCVALDDARFAVHAHAIGDRAVREVLDGLTAARRVNGPRDGRHQISHLQLIDPADLPRFRALGVVANCQPYWAVHGGAVDDLARPLLGDERTDRMYPFGSLARLGATLALGSDWSVDTPHPMLVMEVATRRTPPSAPGSVPFGPSSERLSAEVATRAYTRGSAYANGLDEFTGTIEEGRPADLVLLDRDPVATPGVAFRDTRVLLTMVDGAVVWADPALDELARVDWTGRGVYRTRVPRRRDQVTRRFTLLSAAMLLLTLAASPGGIPAAARSGTASGPTGAGTSVELASVDPKLQRRLQAVIDQAQPDKGVPGISAAVVTPDDTWLGATGKQRLAAPRGRHRGAHAHRHPILHRQRDQDLRRDGDPGADPGGEAEADRPPVGLGDARAVLPAGSRSSSCCPTPVVSGTCGGTRITTGGWKGGRRTSGATPRCGP